MLTTSLRVVLLSVLRAMQHSAGLPPLPMIQQNNVSSDVLLNLGHTPKILRELVYSDAPITVLDRTVLNNAFKTALYGVHSLITQPPTVSLNALTTHVLSMLRKDV